MIEYMKTIALTAPTGMLGSMVYKIFKDKYKLVLIYHDETKLDLLDQAYGGVAQHKKVCFDLANLYKDYETGFPGQAQGARLRELVSAIGEVDGFLHCAGITNRYAGRDPLKTFFINSAVPRLLSNVYQNKLIHITTDCVYNGVAGAPYTELSQKTATDLYGLTKALGEPAEQSLVLRTSFIGPEIADFVGLISWFCKQEGQTLNGFTNHFWNGITTRELARVYDDILSNREQYPRAGLFHIFSNAISKYAMLTAFREKYKINSVINPIVADPIDRRLGSIYDFCKKLKIPPFQQMLEEL